MNGMFQKRKKKAQKLNLIPIMDAVFIFIFFLLMSAQFIDIYEIESDAPAIVTINNQITKDKPLNLILEISKQHIIVKTGLDESVVKRITKNGEGKYDLLLLNTSLMNIKLKNIDESSVIFRPHANVPYADLIVIMDSTMRVKGEKEISAENKKGNVVRTTYLFNRIVFETII